jgi:ferredoxin
MTHVRFISADGRSTREVNAAPGQRLLDVAQEQGQPLEGTCEGQMACSTCHVIVADEDWTNSPGPAKRKTTSSTSPPTSPDIPGSHAKSC